MRGSYAARNNASETCLETIQSLGILGGPLQDDEMKAKCPP
jgi:hypothetical protein